MASASDRRDEAVEPDGFVVLVPPGDRIHFLDWGGASAPAIVLVHGLAATALGWATAARRLTAVGHVVAMDLRGHGLSDSPTEPGAYDLDVLASDVVAVAEAAGGDATSSVVLAGHGFGAIVAAVAAAVLGRRCRGLVLVDGGLSDIAETTGIDVEEFLRGIDEPPEVMRSMTAYLADRRAWDPASWDGDEEKAARAAVVETPAGRLVPVTRPHALEACVRSMFEYRPAETVAAVAAPIVAIRRRAGADADASAASAASAARPHAAIDVIEVDAPGHNLLRYRPDEVVAAIAQVATLRAGR